jgi:hypothetical protein
MVAIEWPLYKKIIDDAWEAYDDGDSPQELVDLVLDGLKITVEYPDTNDH